MVAVLMCGMLTSAAHSQKYDDVAALKAEVTRLYWAGNYTEATEIAKRLLAIGEKALGVYHPGVRASLADLAKLYQVVWSKNSNGGRICS